MGRWPLVALALVIQLARVAPTVYKCCPEGQGLDLHSKVCRDMESVKVHTVSHISQKYPRGANISIERSYTVKPENAWEACNLTQSYIILNFHVIQLTLYDVINKAGRQEFCLDTAHDFKTGDVEPVAKLCSPCTDPEKPCVNFCCQPGRVGLDCGLGDEQLEWVEEAIGGYTRMTVPLHCAAPYQYGRHLVNLSRVGMVVDGLARHFSEYCIQSNPNKSYSVQFCDQQQINQTLSNLKIVLLVLSLISLIVLILVHTLIHDLWKQPFTKLKVPFYICTFASFFFLVISQFEATESNAGLCIFLGLMNQYWSITMFCWLTVMSRNIWATFRTLSNPFQFPQARKARQKKELKWANIISFGAPLIITLITLVIQVSADSSVPFYPKIEQSCFIAQHLPLFLYFHLPLILLLITNLLLYSILVFMFSCGLWSSAPAADAKEWIASNWRNLRVVLELFVFMGIYWLAGVNSNDIFLNLILPLHIVTINLQSVGFFIKWQDNTNWDHPVLSFFEHVNQATGLLILAAFLAKRNNRELVRELLVHGKEYDQTEMCDTGTQGNTRRTSVASVSVASVD